MKFVEIERSKRVHNDSSNADLIGWGASLQVLLNDEVG